MNIISFLSAKIEYLATKFSEFLITILPFLDIYLNENPENIMLVIGFGGQALFAARFLIQWITLHLQTLVSRHGYEDSHLGT